MYVAKQCLLKGLEQVKPGNYTGDIAYAIQTYAESFGYGVVEDLLSHGIGREIHEEPFYPHVGQPGTGTELTPGMVLTVEPMINEGTPFSSLTKTGGPLARLTVLILLNSSTLSPLRIKVYVY